MGAQIADQLRLAGYAADSGIPIVLLSYSGAAQVATGAVDELFTELQAPLWLITLGGFHNGANDLTDAVHLYRLTSSNDWIERVSTWLFPERWPLFRRSAWNRARDADKVTVHSLDPATHIGPLSYISPTAHLTDGRSYLDRTKETVIDIIRRDCGAHAAGTL